MTRHTALTHEFVDYIPDDLKEGVVYVCIQFATVVHKCCCGCGREVVTPLSPTDWTLIFDGDTISLAPSIGNWSFPCRSHYWIRRDRVTWAPQLSAKQIEAGRAYDRLQKEEYFQSTKGAIINDRTISNTASGEGEAKRSLWAKLKDWWS